MENYNYINTDLISNIDLVSSKSWKNKIFLTIDIDWAHDDILNDTIDLIESYEVCATWFVTHATPVLKRLTDNPKFELGIHPNFNSLLDGSAEQNLSSYEIIKKLIEIVPNATSVRSHSLTQSSRILEEFGKFGITHDVNNLIPHNSGILLKPWRMPNGLIRVPYGWEDDVYIEFERNGCHNESPAFIAQQVNYELKVYDFHPIHIFLNTESLQRYESSRQFHYNPKGLKSYRFEGDGTRNRLIDLLKVCKRDN